jgi:predicted HNH restriction endonuclease
MREVIECHISIDLYNDLLGFKPRYRPYGPRVLVGEQALSILSHLGVNDTNNYDGEQITLSPEGRRKYRRHLLVERRPTNRTKVLSIKPSICEVCGFDFLKYYGSAVGSYAEVHHLKPLSLGEQHAQGVDDFAVLCANCHRAIHRPTPSEPMSVTALKMLIASAGTTK